MSNTQNQIFLKSLPKTAGMIANKLGLQIVQDPNQTAATDGKTIWLPILDSNAEIGDREVFMGYFTHECGHCRYTGDHRPEFHRDNLLHTMCNCVEDVRIEHLLCARFPGARYYLSKVVSDLTEYWKDVFSKKEVDQNTCYGMLIAFGGRYICSQRAESKTIADLAEKHIRDKKILEQVKRLIPEISNCKDFADAEDLGKKFWLLIKNQNDQPQSQQSQGSNSQQGDQDQDQSQSQEGQSSPSQGSSSQNDNGNDQGQDSASQNQNQSQNSQKPQGQSEDGSGNGNGNGNGKDKENQSGDQSQNQSQDQNQNQNSNGQGDQSQSGQDADGNGDGNGQGCSNSNMMTDEEVMDMLSGRNLSRGSQNKASDGKSYTLEDFIKDADIDGQKFNDMLQEAKDEVRLPSLSHEELNGKKATCPPLPYREEEAVPVMREADLLANGLKRSLRSILEARGRVKSAVGLSGRTIERTKLARLGTWDLRVFKKEKEDRTHSVAIHILVDRSGSMTKANMHAAKVAALAAYKAVAATPDADPAVSVFPGFTRGHHMEICIPHGCSRKLQNETKKFASVTGFGFTPFRQAVEGCRVILSNQNVDRRVLIVLTDGRVDQTDMDEGLRYRLERDGVELCLITIGLGNNNPFPDLIEHYEDITEAKEIVPAVLRMTKTMVLK
jgi:hypothetical protein